MFVGIWRMVDIAEAKLLGLLFIFYEIFPLLNHIIIPLHPLPLSSSSKFECKRDLFI